jgi:hypothetical protein
MEQRAKTLCGKNLVNSLYHSKHNIKTKLFLSWGHKAIKTGNICWLETHKADL